MPPPRTGFLQWKGGEWRKVRCASDARRHPLTSVIVSPCGRLRPTTPRTAADAFELDGGSDPVAGRSTNQRINHEARKEAHPVPLH